MVVRILAGLVGRLGTCKLVEALVDGDEILRKRLKTIGVDGRACEKAELFGLMSPPFNTSKETITCVGGQGRPH